MIASTFSCVPLAPTSICSGTTNANDTIKIAANAATIRPAARRPRSDQKRDTQQKVDTHGRKHGPLQPRFDRCVMTHELRRGKRSPGRIVHVVFDDKAAKHEKAECQKERRDGAHYYILRGNGRFVRHAPISVLSIKIQNTTTLRIDLPPRINSNASLIRGSGSVCVIMGSI